MAGDDRDADATGSVAPEIHGTAPRLGGTVSPGDRLSEEPEAYAIESQIGAGGMGTVMAARSTRFGRSVAVKMITVDRDDLRRRFEREANVTARLQHPSIVPVYGAGRSADGRPFYAMKQVTGRPLDKVVATTPSLADRIALVPTVIAVSDAIAYAHSEEVIHRDLKPANILVGAFGETIVIDWGLAKELASADTDEADGAPYRTAGADETAYGKVMGTPAYMPPEQARGEHVDKRADVYALGAILYHVLAGGMPYVRSGEGSVPWESMVARVMTGAPPPLRELQPTLPPDLLAIVDRAMSREPGDRYPSAGEFADDLKRFQSGQLVGAHQYSSWQLVKRWIRRHRTAVIVGGAAIVLLAALGGVSLNRIFDEQARTERQRIASDRHRGEAEDLMGFMLGDLRKKLVPINKLELLDDVATKAVHYYDDKGELSDPDLERQAIARQSLASVLTARARNAEADTQLRAALDTLRAVTARAPDELDWQAQLGRCEIQLGDLLIDEQNHASEALVQYRSARAIGERLTSAQPDNLAYQTELGQAHLQIGNVVGVQIGADAAIAEFRLALALFVQVAAKSSPGDRSQFDVAAARTKLGVMLALKGDLAGGLAEHVEQLRVLEAYAAVHPSDAEASTQIQYSHARLGDMYSQMSEFGKAESEQRIAVSLADAIAKQDPANPTQQFLLAKTAISLADTLARKGDAAHALEMYTRARTICESIIATSPADSDALSYLAGAETGTGNVILARGDSTKAAGEYRKATEILARLAAGDPTSSLWPNLLSDTLNKEGDALDAGGDHAGAIAQYHLAVQAVEPLAKRDPTNASTLQQLASGHLNLAQAVLAAGDAKQAVAEFRLALTELESTPAFSPLDLATTRQGLGRALIAAGDPAAAVAELTTAVTGAQALLSEHSDNPAIYTRLAALLEARGDAQLAHADPAAAVVDFAAFRSALEKLAALDPATDHAGDVVESAERIGDAYAAKHDAVLAAKAYRDARGLLTGMLARKDAKRAELIPRVAGLDRKLATCCR